MIDEMKFIKEHECDTMKKYNDTCKKRERIAIAKYYDSDWGKSWFWNKRHELDGIEYCPYCGIKLGDEKNN